MSGLTTYDITSQSISVSWVAATGTFDDYVVTYAATDDADSTSVATRIPNGDSTVAVIDNLFPDTEYIVSVYTSSGGDDDGTTSDVESIVANTSE